MRKARDRRTADIRRLQELENLEAKRELTPKERQEKLRLNEKWDNPANAQRKGPKGFVEGMGKTNQEVKRPKFWSDDPPGIVSRVRIPSWLGTLLEAGSRLLEAATDFSGALTPHVRQLSDPSEGAREIYGVDGFGPGALNIRPGNIGSPGLGPTPTLSAPEQRFFMRKR